MYAGALRELAEEAGIVDRPFWAVDVTHRKGAAGDPGTWALFAVDVPHDTPIDLVDPEHDRYAWLDVPEACRRARPPIVSEALAKVAAVPLVSLTFRAMVESDLVDVARWHRAPHVARWFRGDGSTDEEVRLRLLPRLRGETPVRLWIVEADGRPAGWLQDYQLADQGEYAAKAGDTDGVGFDYAIGEPDLVERGLGTRMVWESCRDVLRREHPTAPRFVASPSHRNRRSIRALEKCGFMLGLWIDPPAAPGEQPETEVVCTLDVAHWFGPPRERADRSPA